MSASSSSMHSPIVLNKASANGVAGNGVAGLAALPLADDDGASVSGMLLVSVPLGDAGGVADLAALLGDFSAIPRNTASRSFAPLGDDDEVADLAALLYNTAPSVGFRR